MYGRLSEQPTVSRRTVPDRGHCVLHQALFSCLKLSVWLAFRKSVLSTDDRQDLYLLYSKEVEYIISRLINMRAHKFYLVFGSNFEISQLLDINLCCLKMTLLVTKIIIPEHFTIQIGSNYYRKVVLQLDSITKNVFEEFTNHKRVFLCIE